MTRWQRGHFPLNCEAGGCTAAREAPIAGLGRSPDAAGGFCGAFYVVF